MKTILLALLISSPVFAAVQKTEVCSLGKIVKKVELVSEAEASPCKITYQGAAKWHFNKETAKCEPTFTEFVAHLEKKGFDCKAEAKAEAAAVVK